MADFPTPLLLPWDTRFYGRDVFKLELGHTSFSMEYLKEVPKGALVYVYTKRPIPELGTPLDTRLTLQCELNRELGGAARSKRCEIYDFDLSLRPQLHELAITSSRMSRFRLDPQLSPSKADEMYRIWIDNAIKDPNGHKIVLARTDDFVAGMISIRVLPKHFSIELVAVRDQSQGEGYGSELMATSLGLAYEMNIETVSVVTQSQNDSARGLYEKYGFTSRDMVHIYHLHL